MRFLDVAIGQPTFFDPKSAWLRHGPFGMWLVGALQPRRIVELGTHNGYSYFAFCQAVQEHQLPTDCIAVDTWQGDEHAGFYGDEVYDAVTQLNVPYANFSTLLRKTFAEALTDVEDGSVDLLHVDGRHFYEDVKEDFESWIPKLSSRAVVLFHDTEVKERGFGVWKYWAEISADKAALNFPHQHGLGVLFWGAELQQLDTSGSLVRLLSLLDNDGVMDAVITAFVLAGEESVRRHVLGDMENIPPEQLPDLMIDYLEQLTRVRTDCAVMQGQIADLNDRLVTERDASDLKIAALSQDLSETQRKLAEHIDLLSDARRSPGKLVKSLVTFRILSLLLRMSPPLPRRMAENFARSAKKRDPERASR